MIKGVELNTEKLHYSLAQPADNNCSGNDSQVLDISIEQCGGGPYLVLSTDRWALDIEDIAELADILKEIAKKW